MRKCTLQLTADKSLWSMQSSPVALCGFILLMTPATCSSLNSQYSSVSRYRLAGSVRISLNVVIMSRFLSNRWFRSKKINLRSAKFLITLLFKYWSQNYMTPGESYYLRMIEIILPSLSSSSLIQRFCYWSSFQNWMNLCWVYS